MPSTEINPRMISIRTLTTAFHIPPALWKGDPGGHIGANDVFFYILEGEVILFIDSRYYSVKAGQMAFLPKGKMRKYTQVSDRFTMYELRFFAEIGEKNLMEALGVVNGNYVISVPDNEKMTEFFINSYHDEMNRDYLYDIACSANTLNIIKTYVEEVRKQSPGLRKDYTLFEELITFMQDNVSKNITISDLTDIAHMESTYLIRKFKKVYGIPPLSYFGNMKYHKATELLFNTDLSIDSVAKALGFNDIAYFSRWFKKFCSISPTEYRKSFGR